MLRVLEASGATGENQEKLCLEPPMRLILSYIALSDAFSVLRSVLMAHVLVGQAVKSPTGKYGFVPSPPVDVSGLETSARGANTKNKQSNPSCLNS